MIDKQKYPLCYHDNCFQCRGGRCMILLEAFDPCPFFKTELQAEKDRQHAHDLNVQRKRGQNKNAN